MENNNQSMNTVIETFYVSETVNLIHDNDALTKWNEKVEELKLSGQKEVVKEDKSPIPFLWMNSAIVSTFETLCPTKIDIKKYDKTPIPVELLEVVSLCVKEDYFDCIKVWYNEKQKDPVIVGYVAKKGEKKEDWQFEYYGQKYLIGRWADVKASLDQLIERAKKVFIQSETFDLKREIKDRQRKLEDLEQLAHDKFGNAMPVTDLPF